MISALINNVVRGLGFLSQEVRKNNKWKLNAEKIDRLFKN